MTAPFAKRAPTLAPILEGAACGLRRFPLTIAAGLVAAAAAILLQEDIGDEATLERLVASAVLGLSLLTGLRVLSGRRRWGRGAAWLADGAGVLVLAGFYVGWGRWSEPVQVARLFQLLAVFHLFVAVAPYVTGSAGRGFWEYNRALFERILVALVYVHVLYAGAAIALVALDQLFGVPVADGGYLRLWFVAILFLSPWFFVAGIPSDMEALERETAYQPGLRAFTRFALLPIVALYLLILLAYFVKVLATWQWPSGWIGWLVSAVAVAGIFSLLLVHPLQDRPGDRWVGTYARAFYALILPAVVMLWLAIWQRVGQYGVTERRYFLIVLSVWLAGVAAYQLLTRARGIRVIPASLCLVGLATFAGPWGAYRTSERSQVSRLAGIFARHDMLRDGRVTPATGDVPNEDRREVEEILRYLGETHGFAAVAAWFPDSLRARRGPLADARPRQDARAARDIMTALALPAPTGARRGQPGFRYTARSGADPLTIGGYDLLLRVTGWSTRASPDSGWSVVGDTLATALVVRRDGSDVVSFPLAGLIRELEATGAARRSLRAEELRVEGMGALRAVLYLHSLGGRFDDERVVITDIGGVLLLAGPPAGRALPEAGRRP